MLLACYTSVKGWHAWRCTKSKLRITYLTFCCASREPSKLAFHSHPGRVISASGGSLSSVARGAEGKTMDTYVATAAKRHTLTSQDPASRMPIPMLIRK